MTETVQSAIAAQLDALGIPSHIDTESYPSIVALFEDALATFGATLPAFAGFAAFLAGHEFGLKLTQLLVFADQVRERRVEPGLPELGLELLKPGEQEILLVFGIEDPFRDPGQGVVLAQGGVFDHPFNIINKALFVADETFPSGFR